jgi:hypothetical protein
MTQTPENKAQPEAVELEDAQLEQAQGGIRDGTSNRAQNFTTQIKDGSSNTIVNPGVNIAGDGSV